MSGRAQSSAGSRARSRPHAAALLAPVAVREFDLRDPPESLRLYRPNGDPDYRSLMVLARLGPDPLGLATFPLASPADWSPDRLGGELEREFEYELAVAGSEPARARDPCRDFDRSFDPAHSENSQPPVSVVVATCGNVHALERCLRSIFDCDYGDFEVIVVENRPEFSDTQWMIETQFATEPRLRYVEEPRRGASHARNAGLASASGEVVAFADDDVVVDAGWIRACVGGLTSEADVGCCTGLILPMELESPSQVLLEQFAAFGKGFRRRTYRLSQAADDRLLPHAVGSIGSGASMTLRTRVARELGGFDTALGPGTPATGAEDLDLLARLLLAGHAVTYEPRAMVWHQHPEGIARLQRLAFRYGLGLSSLLTKQLICGPRRRELLRSLPAGVRYLTDSASRKNVGRPSDFPRALLWRERVGMLAGPPAYLSSVVLDRLRSLGTIDGQADV